MTEPRWVKLSERKPEIGCLKQKQYTFSDGNTYWCDFDIPYGAIYWLEEYLPPLPKEEKPADPHHYYKGRRLPQEIIDASGLPEDLLEKPVDPDWEKFDKNFNRDHYDDYPIGELFCEVAAIYEFLKAKYGH